MFFFSFFIFFFLFFKKISKKILQKGAKAGGKAPKKSTSAVGADGKEEAHGILEGISSLHSWIKTQTMIRPHPKSGARGGKPGALYDEVN